MCTRVSRHVVAALVAYPLAVGAQIQDGAWFLRTCGAALKQADGKQVPDEEAVGALYCLSYLSGFADATSLGNSNTKGKPLICLPDKGVSNDQALRVFVKYLRDNPGQLHESGRTSLYIALAKTFPCRP